MGTLAESLPELGAEWHETRNDGLSPDEVSVGDFHIPSVVGYALLGRPLDDAGMLEVLAPYAPQRQRAVRYIEASGFRRPRFGPRLHPRDYRAM